MLKHGAFDAPGTEFVPGASGATPLGVARTPRQGPGCRRCPARAECADHAARFLQGYELPADARARLHQWRRTRLLKSVLSAGMDSAVIPGVVILHLLLLDRSPVLAIVLYVPAVVLVSRMLRALEVLLHEGSHYNWTRRRGRNDALVNTFAGLPVFQTVRGYRAAHAWHHKHLGRCDDPCRRRAEEFGWGTLSRTSAGAYARRMLAALPAYRRSWWRTVRADRKAVARGAAWHAVVTVLPAAAVLTTSFRTTPVQTVAFALLAWVAYVGVSFAAVLPVLRYMAEAAEHDYRTGTTTWTATFTNVGPLHGFLHPHGDGYHFLHHVDPSIPHHQLRAVHRWLTRHDPAYAAGRQRSRVLDEGVTVPRPRPA